MGKRMAELPCINLKKTRSHRKKPRHKEAMPHPQKFQHSTGILIHKLASLIMYILGLSDGWCKLGSWGWARHPFFHWQKTASIQSEQHCSPKPQIHTVVLWEPALGLICTQLSTAEAIERGAQKEENILAKKRGGENWFQRHSKVDQKCKTKKGMDLKMSECGGNGRRGCSVRKG